MGDWFRSETWDRESFEQRLARARPQSRPQYLRIQGLTFLETGQPELQPIAIALLERVYSDESEEAAFERPTAPEFLGKAYEAVGSFERAAALYLEAIERQRGANHHGNPEFRLGAMVVREKLSGYYEKAFEILTDPALDSHAVLDWHRFERAKYIAFLADRLGKQAIARDSAAHALSLAATRTRPQFPRHPTVGRIETDKATLKALRHITASS